MNTSEIRSRFLSFFEREGHSVQPSSPLVPGNDPTLLFTNAGMVQFKDVFLGHDPRPYSRAVSSQRCVRAGGKHNDLENVGYTARHHTFFEMLGNFSFGDYFKEEAISFAWRFLTEELAIPKEKLWVTVYTDDDEAADIWTQQIGVPIDRLSRLGEKDNFWSMGDTGPCGPCTEIFYDHGPEVAGDPPGGPNDDGDRYIEVWNLVFMQFNRHADGSMEPLPKPSVDTGMGLERIAAVMQGVHNNYDIDLFEGLIASAARVLEVKDIQHTSLKVIADHIRSAAFLIVDGVLPGNEGRGYVLRRIIRRALRHGHKLGSQSPFFHSLVSSLEDAMGQAYPELAAQQAFVEQALLKEEKQFARTLGNGMKILDKAINELEGNTLSGEVAFLLYDTYGFPLDLTKDIAREHELRVDDEGFEVCMEQQRNRARKASAFQVDYNDAVQIDGETEFQGYEHLDIDSAKVLEIRVEGKSAASLSEGEQAMIVLDKTPFYGESGGQVGDAGELISAQGMFMVSDTQKIDQAFVHIGQLKTGTLSVGDAVNAKVNQARRNAIRLHHTATHLLHAVLRDTLGTHVQQKGSLVSEQNLRFDFSHPEAVGSEALKGIEQKVNQLIQANTDVTTDVTSIDEAKSKGAMMLFGEKYSEEVRVLSMGDGFSVELCGGTHAERTGDLGVFKIVSESAIASGVRRIEALAGSAAVDFIQSLSDEVSLASSRVKARSGELVDRIDALLQKNKAQESEIKQLKIKLATGANQASEVIKIDDLEVLVKKIEDVDPKSLRSTLDSMKKPLKKGVVCLASVVQEKVHVVCSVDPSVVDKIGANQILKAVLEPMEGRGGGKPAFAQGGAALSPKLDEVLSSIPDMIRKAVAS